MFENCFKSMIALVLLCSMAMAIPSIPHQFFGTVTVNGASAADGTVVTAAIDGVTVSSGTTISGKYGQVSNVFFVTDANGNRAGKIVLFYVSGVNTGVSYIFANGASTRLDFSVTVQAPPGGGSTGGGGGSSGGGGGGGGVSVETEHAVAEYQIGDLHVTRSFYYNGNNVVMKMVYQNTGTQTLYNVDITDELGQPFGKQTAYFSSIAPGEKKYDEYELGQWMGLYQMNALINAAKAPGITVGQVGATPEKPAPAPTKTETNPEERPVIPPASPTPTSAPTGFFLLGADIGLVAIAAVLAIIVAALAFYFYKKRAKSAPARKTRRL
jgi:hypothetical protein